MESKICAHGGVASEFSSAEVVVVANTDDSFVAQAAKKEKNCTLPTWIDLCIESQRLVEEYDMTEAGAEPDYFDDQCSNCLAGCVISYKRLRHTLWKDVLILITLIL